MCPPRQAGVCLPAPRGGHGGVHKTIRASTVRVSQRRPRPDWFAERFAWAVPVLPYVAHGCGVGLGRLPVVLPRCGLGEHPRDLAPCPCLVGDDLGGLLDCHGHAAACTCFIRGERGRRGHCRRRLALPLGLADKPSGNRPYSNCQVLVKGKFCLRRLGPAGRADRRCSWSRLAVTCDTAVPICLSKDSSTPARRKGRIRRINPAADGLAVPFPRINLQLPMSWLVELFINLWATSFGHWSRQATPRPAGGRIAAIDRTLPFFWHLWLRRNHSLRRCRRPRSTACDYGRVRPTERPSCQPPA